MLAIIKLQPVDNCCKIYLRGVWTRRGESTIYFILDIFETKTGFIRSLMLNHLRIGNSKVQDYHWVFYGVAIINGVSLWHFYFSL